MNDEQPLASAHLIYRRFGENDLQALAVLLEQTPEVALSGDDTSLAALLDSVARHKVRLRGLGDDGRVV